MRGVANLVRHLELLRAQKYAQYRIIASVEAGTSCLRALSAAQREPGAPLKVTVAGLAKDAEQKVVNQLAALERLKPDDAIVAFIDADSLPTPLWLPRLVAADDSLAALPRGGLPLSIVWGGSAAVRRETLDSIRIRDFWRGAISDDFQMAEALRQAKLLTHAPPRGSC